MWINVSWHIFRHGFIVSDQDAVLTALTWYRLTNIFQPPNIRMFQSVDGLNIIHSALPWFYE